MCFFFSSRRRHTRYIGDWSSDVCSSDLLTLAYMEGEQRDPNGNLTTITKATIEPSPVPAPTPPQSPAPTPVSRSEERRVGKECISQTVADQLTKKHGAKSSIHSSR